MVSIYDLDGIEQLRIDHAVQPHAMKRFRNALFKHAAEPVDALEAIPQPIRDVFKEAISFECMELVERHDSKIDAASKLIFKTTDDHLVESVLLRPQTGRTSICISSQVGCACRCSFCATGNMGFVRNLTAGEILDQVVQANRMIRSEDRRIRNVVFMGMGEPLLNYDPVRSALEILQATAFFNRSPSHLTVSTVGIPHVMERLAADCPDVQLALSLHSARQEVRERLMPQAARYPLSEMRESLERLSRSGRIMIEYLMLEEVNDSNADLEALIQFLQGMSVHVNIIPFNEYAGCSLRGTPRPRREMFARRLKAEGFDATLRYSLGADISAACGQLIQHKRKGVVGA